MAQRLQAALPSPLGALRLGSLAAVAAAPLLLGAAAPAADPGASHSFTLTYEDFGTVRPTSGFSEEKGYALRFEGCYAKKTVEAVCGFTLRANAPMVVTNASNFSHATSASGEELRTCCIFVTGDPRGWPIRKPGALEPAAGVLDLRLAAGESRGLMLRVPDAGTRGPLAGIFFSAGAGDPGEAFAAHVVELKP